MPKFQKKSDPVEAIEWTGKNSKAIMKMCGSTRMKNDRLYVDTLAGLVEVPEGDYVFEDGTVVSADNIEANYKEVK